MMQASSQSAQIVQANWQRVVEQVGAARDAAGRSDSVEIVGVSKYVDAELSEQLVASGCQVLGENRPQSLWEKSAWFDENARSQPSWHMIGHLQRNKVRRTLPIIDCLHSLDSLRLAETLQQEADRIEVTLPVLIEVNVTSDESKTGLPATKLEAFVSELLEFSRLEISGLMAMSTHHAEPDQTRREFALVRELRDQMQTQFPSQSWRELSMGMSGDFEQAIAEGATMVRIGSSLWEGIR